MSANSSVELVVFTALKPLQLCLPLPINRVSTILYRKQLLQKLTVDNMVLIICTIYGAGSLAELLIERDSLSSVILPRPDWQTINHTGKTATIKYKIRVLCDEHYYNTTCTKLCRPRNDKFGHYNCDLNGDKECLEGWIGNNCQTGSRPIAYSIRSLSICST